MANAVDLNNATPASWALGTTGATVVLTVTRPDGVTATPSVTEASGVYTATVSTPLAGRYILSASVFDKIRQLPRGSGGEIQLTDGIAQLIEGEGVHAYQYAGKCYDCGSKQGFLEATVELALKHPEVGAEFSQYLRRTVC